MTKIKVTYSIDKDIQQEFTLLAEEHAINRSKFVENCIRRWVEKYKNERISDNK